MLEDDGTKYRTEKSGDVLGRRLKPTPGCNAKEEEDEEQLACQEELCCL
jgi:hypothetical protein